MSLVLIERSADGIVTLTLNRPEAANALSRALLTELLATLDDLRYDTTARCVILTGSGGKVFCAGADLKERRELDIPGAKRASAMIGEVALKLEALPQPVIVALSGGAYGGGCEIALGGDIRIAAAGIRIGLTETSLGIIPGAGGTQRLPRLVGVSRAKELIYTARRITAEEALEIGLVNHVVVAEQLLEKANLLAHEMVKNAPLSLAQAKLAINKGTDVDLANGLAIESAAYAPLWATEDRLEGLQAFKEKRPPVYKGK
jgi:enoyl-CoA hydratase/carnithine racemase